MKSFKSKKKIHKSLLYFVISMTLIFVASHQVFAATLLSDDFTGTTIDTGKWTELDPAGAGGSSGDVQQNGSLTVGNSFSGTWGQTALISVDTFDSSLLEISAVMNRSSDQLLGYGDYNFQSAGTQSYVIDLSATGVLALVWDNAALTDNTNCGSYTAGATYKMTIIATGFEVYKNDVLLCTMTTALGITDELIYLQSSASASTFDDVEVTGTAVLTIPDAPTALGTTVGDTEIPLSWSAPVNNGGSALTDYLVEYKLSSAGVWTTFSDGVSTATTATVTGLTNDLSYDFRVSAINAIGTGAASSVVSGTPTPPTAPNQVQSVEVTAVNQQVLIHWDVPSDGGSALTDYLVEYKLSSAGVWTTFSDGVSTSIKTVITGLANDTTYNFRISAINAEGTGTVSSTVSTTPRPIENIAFVTAGESNSGGIGLNSDATAAELLQRSAVQIMNLTSGNFLFEDLDIGTNNLRDHAGLESYYDDTHGFELQLANSTEANALPDNPQVHLTKTGQGGSIISEWNDGGAYWTKFLERTSSAKDQLTTDRQWVVWMSIGINDGIAGTDTSTFKTSMVEWIDRIKADLPNAIIIMTQFQSMTANSGYPDINTKLSEIATEEGNVYIVDSTGAGLRDGNHWNYAGLKTVASSMVDVTQEALGLLYPGKPTGLTTDIGTTSVDLDWTAPIAIGENSIIDYIIEYKPSTSSTWTTFVDGVSTDTLTTVTDLTEGVQYDLRVSAINSSGTGNAIATSITLPAIVLLSTQISGSSSYSQAEVKALFAKAQEEQVVEQPQEETQCTLLTQNLKVPARNGIYHPYTKAIVTEAKLLQEHLNRLGFNAGPIDGIIGTLTDTAIKQMQTSLKVVVDGYVDPNTRNAINESCTLSFTPEELLALIASLKEQIVVLQR